MSLTPLSMNRWFWRSGSGLALAVLLHANPARADIITGLLVWLKMDETNGLTAFDATTNRYNASLINFSGDNSQWVTGRTNGGLLFNAAASDQRAIIPDAGGALNFANRPNPALSLAVWAKGTAGQPQSPGAALIAKGYGHGGDQYGLDLYNNAYRVWVRNASGTVFTVAPGLPCDGTWQHIVGTFDSSAASNGLKLYLNGVLCGAVNGPTNLLNTSHELSLGSRENYINSGYNLPFYGTLDEARIYARPLSAADVLELYNADGGPPPPVPEAEFTALRLLWRDMLNGGTNLNTADPDVIVNLAGLSASAQSSWQSMNRSAGRMFLWSDMPNLASDSGQIWYTYDRLKTIALAYTTRGSGLYTNSILRADLLAALDWMYTNIYNETKSQVGNWWHWQIGVPLRLNDITVLLYDTLSGAQVTNYMNAVNHFTPAPNGTAANLVWTATVVAVRGAIVKDSGKIHSAAWSLSTVFPYVSSGDGFYADGSFVYHTCYPYTGSYGSSLIGFLAQGLHLLDGSPWEVTAPNLTNVFQWVYKAYQPVICKGAIMDMVRGRAISRAAEADQVIGQQTVAAMIRLAQFAPAPDAAAFKSMAKHWMQVDSARGFVTNADLGTIPLAQAILADSNVIPRGELVGHYHFGSMDRVVHLQPGYGFGLSMCSSRIANYESINSENLHGWYTADGMTYLYNADQTQFNDCFWPTVNAYRLPGTTVDTQSRANGSGAAFRGTNNWVGGAALGQWAAAGMQLDAWNSDLTAKKSWFMFDDEIVGLGAGINCTSNRAIETIVENHKLTAAGSNPLTVNGQNKPTALGWAEAMPAVSWAHLAGNVAGADIGYYFPQPVLLNGVREARSGAWHDINNFEIGSTTNLITRNYLALWFSHGTNPINANYSYVLLPGKSAAETGNYAGLPKVEVLCNWASIQAVREGPLGLTAANFWNDGMQAAGGITVDRKSSVVMQVTETNLSVAVADPTQTNTTGISLGINQAVTASLALDPGVDVVRLAPTLQLSINTAGGAGKSYHASFLRYVTNFADFQAVHFSPRQLVDPSLSGPLADPDHDGLPNLLEYALLLDPWQPDAAGLPFGLESGRFWLTYPRRKLASDLAYTIEVSTNLVWWDGSQTQLEQTMVSEGATTQTIQVKDMALASSQTRRFFRLRVTLWPGNTSRYRPTEPGNAFIEPPALLNYNRNKSHLCKI